MRRGILVGLCVALAIGASLAWGTVTIRSAQAKAIDTSATAGVIVDRNHLTQGSCLATSYFAGVGAGYLTFSLTADRFEVVPCTAPHSAEVLARIAVPATQQWADYGTSAGPSSDEARDLVNGSCWGFERLLNAARDDDGSAAKPPPGSYVSAATAPIGEPVLGFCALVSPTELVGSWWSALTSQLTMGRVAADQKSDLGDIREGSCLTRMNGPDVAWDSVGECAQPHRFVVLGGVSADYMDVEWTQRTSALYSAIAEERASTLAELGPDPERATFIAEFDACWDLFAREAGLPSSIAGLPDGITFESLRMRPAGGFYADVSLPTADMWLLGEGVDDTAIDDSAEEALCSVAWTDPVRTPRPIRLPESASIADLYSTLPIETTLCWGDDLNDGDYSDSLIDCRQKHWRQALVTFDATPFLTEKGALRAIATGVVPAVQLERMAPVCDAVQEWINLRADRTIPSARNAAHNGDGALEQLTFDVVASAYPATWAEVGYRAVSCNVLAFDSELNYVPWVGSAFDGHDDSEGPYLYEAPG